MVRCVFCVFFSFLKKEKEKNVNVKVMLLFLSMKLLNADVHEFLPGRGNMEPSPLATGCPVNHVTAVLALLVPAVASIWAHLRASPDLVAKTLWLSLS